MNGHNNFICLKSLHFELDHAVRHLLAICTEIPRVFNHASVSWTDIAYREFDYSLFDQLCN